VRTDSFSAAEHSVLIVDDTMANRRLYGILLAREGFIVRTAQDGVEALRSIESETPSLVLLDYIMPNMNGVEVLDHLRRDPKTARLPVVMLTASAEPDHIDAALEAGANDYITKPVNSRILLARVKSMIQADRMRGRPVRRLESELLEELEEAARVQKAQLPAVPMKWNDWRVTGAVAPSGQVGGDIFDLVPTDDGRFIALLLDVSGHGTASALVAAETRAELRTLLSGRSLLESVRRLNAHMARRETGKYSCLAAVEIEGSTLRILNAGLPPVAVLRGSRVLAEVWGSGTPIGMFEDSTYELTEFEVAAGDRIVMLSDGLTEPFGATDDARSAISRLMLWPSVRDEVPEPDVLRTRITTLTRDSAPELRDDATAVILHLTGSVHEVMRLAARPAAIPRAVRWVVDQSPDWADRVAVDHGLTEALTNAVLHGALGLSSEVRHTDAYDEYLTLAHELPDRPGFMDRHVELKMVQNADSFGIRISWQGAACPVEDRLPPAPTSIRSSGMGSSIIHSLFDRVDWDSDGLGLELWLHRGGAASSSDRALLG